MGMAGLADNIIGLIEESMNKRKTSLYADGKLPGSLLIRSRKFQGDSFLPLLFVITLLPLTHILRETGMGYKLEKNKAKVSHLSKYTTSNCMRRMTRMTDSLIKTVWQCNKDIKREFGILKCAEVLL